jgi:hypothetical protein
MAGCLGLCEVEKAVAGRWDEVIVSREVLIDCLHHRHFVSTIRRQPACRFDHQPWDLIHLDLDYQTLERVLLQDGMKLEEASLSVPGNPFVLGLTCPDCFRNQDVFRLSKQLTQKNQTCAACGAHLTIDGFSLRDRVRLSDLPEGLCQRPLAALGMRPGDVFTLESASNVLHYRIAIDAQHPKPPGATLVVLGCGNIGSHFIPHTARMPGVGRVVLVDPDVYEEKNLSSQDIRPEDIGKPKVQVQAARLRAIQPDLDISIFQSRLEDVPLGYFEDAIAISCLDSRIARLRLNEITWRVGSPLVDTAVDAANLLCRVSVLVPGKDNPCLECSWDDADYQLLEQVLSCNPDPNSEDN